MAGISALGPRLQRAFPTDGLLCRSADARPTPSRDPAGQAAFGRRTTTDSIQLLELEATSPDADPAVGDRITIAFSLKKWLRHHVRWPTRSSAPAIPPTTGATSARATSLECCSQ